MSKLGLLIGKTFIDLAVFFLTAAFAALLAINFYQPVDKLFWWMVLVIAVLFFAKVFLDYEVSK